jgi:hypothetical protein
VSTAGILNGTASPMLVEWLDSRQPHAGWVLAEDLDDRGAVAIRSVGYIVRDTAESISLAQSAGGPPEQYMSVIIIPKCCIQSVEPLVRRSAIMSAREAESGA